ncbi:MAG: hypothetical protein JXR88_07465 [Clostridia bacterium]|nr:hypothetical protein [Clostridia bacterium]
MATENIKANYTILESLIRVKDDPKMTDASLITIGLLQNSLLHHILTEDTK